MTLKGPEGRGGRGWLAAATLAGLAALGAAKGSEPKLTFREGLAKAAKAETDSARDAAIAAARERLDAHARTSGAAERFEAAFKESREEESSSGGGK